MSIDDRAFATEVRVLIDQIVVPARPMRAGRRTSPVARVTRGLAAVGVVVAALALALGAGHVINAVRSGSQTATAPLASSALPFPQVTEPQLYTLPPGCVLVGPPTRSTDGSELRWETTCRSGRFTADAYRESIRQFTTGQGWRECASSGALLRFWRGGFEMLIDYLSPNAALAITQRLATGCGP